MICYGAIGNVDGAALEPCERESLEGPEDGEAGNACPPVHRACLSKYLIIQAEEGKFPCTCPFCLRPLSVREVHENLSPRSCRVWLRMHSLWRELRECPGPETNAKGVNTDPDLFQEVRMMQELGYKRCPACGVWIQKQEPGWLTGCDKMTCRCGGSEFLTR